MSDVEGGMTASDELRALYIPHVVYSLNSKGGLYRGRLEGLVRGQL